MTSSPATLKPMRRSPPLRATLAVSGGVVMLCAPVTSIFMVMVALYCSGSRTSMSFMADVVGIVVVFAFEVFEALAPVVVLVVVVLALLAACCWHAPKVTASASAAAVVKNLADGFKAKI